MNTRQIVGTILVAILVAFLLMNWEVATVWFFIGEVQMKVGFVVLFSALLGAGAAVLFGYIKKRGK